MKAEIKVPAVGESITEATIGDWVKKNGEFVKRDEVILSLETDKASVEVVAPNDGVLNTTAKQGEVFKIGAVVAYIDTEGVATAGMTAPGAPTKTAPAPSVGTPAPTAGVPAARAIAPELQSHQSPAVRRVVEERGLDASGIAGTAGTGKDGRLTKADVVNAPGKTTTAETKPAAKSEIPPLPRANKGIGATGGIRRQPMTTIRKRIAERLVQAQHTAAILTTFNEVDMSAVMAVREKYKERFKEKYGVSLGFMGFFVKACIEALKEIPQVNAFIDGTDMVFHDYFNIGVAVGTEKGLVVPVVRDAQDLSIAQVEMAIRHYAAKARDGKLSIEDLSEGTFTITNGGVFGSLMSTPILNPPQSAILGMHKIQDRPVAVAGKVEIRPMMYLALSYDHRIIDGKEAVTFLVKVKECIEDPQRILLEI